MKEAGESEVIEMEVALKEAIGRDGERKRERKRSEIENGKEEKLTEGTKNVCV